MRAPQWDLSKPLLQPDSRNFQVLETEFGITISRNEIFPSTSDSLHPPNAAFNPPHAIAPLEQTFIKSSRCPRRPAGRAKCLPVSNWRRYGVILKGRPAESTGGRPMWRWIV
ncbi:hypothetical protein FRC05_002646, partial [Tulasnella sp. 425]